MVKLLLMVILSTTLLNSVICNADDWGYSPSEEFIWVDSQGSETTPYGIQDEQGGYVVIDKYGNETWVDDIDNPNCSFVAARIQNDDGLFTGDVTSEIYIGGIDFSGCNYE